MIPDDLKVGDLICMDTNWILLTQVIEKNDESICCRTLELWYNADVLMPKNRTFWRVSNIADHFMIKFVEIDIIRVLRQGQVIARPVKTKTIW